jgi:hypothetical protein
VATVVRFFFDDYARLSIPLPAFAASALAGLRDQKSPHALEPGMLEALMNVTRAPRAL